MKQKDIVFWVDIPDQHKLGDNAEWVKVGTFNTRKEAIQYIRENIDGGCTDGTINILTGGVNPITTYKEVPAKVIATYLEVYKQYLLDNNIEDDSKSITVEGLINFIDEEFTEEDREHYRLPKETLF